MRRRQERRGMRVVGCQRGLVLTGGNDAGDTLVAASQPCAISSRGAQGSDRPAFPSSCSQFHFSPSPPSKAHPSQLLSRTPATAAASRLPFPMPFIWTSLFLLRCILFSALPQFVPIGQDEGVVSSSRPGHWSTGRQWVPAF